ncbi:hypothetical protein BCR43DRAFT_483189 [Syncephalastrum racemosum]|uniref:PX domain-containing protein n=1 Tax=Syncephalastrum racemosum TaxID=13706 RepID=A0A1X2HUV1_SYNRA|nr:hypothetical protein BCR43DRAFT_483189 [Syncephalastrum racemosum]
MALIQRMLLLLLSIVCTLALDIPIYKATAVSSDAFIPAGATEVFSSVSSYMSQLNPSLNLYVSRWPQFLKIPAVDTSFLYTTRHPLQNVFLSIHDYYEHINELTSRARRELKQNKGHRTQELTVDDLYAEICLISEAIFGPFRALPFVGFSPKSLDPELRSEVTHQIFVDAPTNKRAVYDAKRHQLRDWAISAREQVNEALHMTEGKFIGMHETCFVYESTLLHDDLEKEWATQLGNIIALAGPMRIVLESTAKDIMRGVRQVHAEAELTANLVRLEERVSFNEQRTAVATIYGKARAHIDRIFNDAINEIEPHFWHKAYWRQVLFDARQYSLHVRSVVQHALQAAVGCNCHQNHSN